MAKCVGTHIINCEIASYTSKTWEEHQKTAPFKKIFLGSLRRGFNTKKILQSRTWQLSQKKYFLLVDYKFIKYTLQFFSLLSLACKTGAPQVLKTDGRPVSAFGG